MNAKFRWMIVAGLLLAVFAFPVSAFAQDQEPEDATIFGGTYTLEDGERLNDLTVFGGSVELEEGSIVDHMTVIGGSIRAAGTVEDDIDMYGGSLDLASSAVVNGDISIIGGSLSQDEGSIVVGDISEGLPIAINVPGLPDFKGPVFISNPNDLGRRLSGFIAQAVGLSVLAMLAILAAPQAIDRAGSAALARPWEAGGVGLLVAILTPVLLIGFAVTLIGIPITLVLGLAVVVLLVSGWIVLGFEVGKRFAKAFEQDWSPVVNAGLGTFMLSLMANAIGMTPCVGWIVPAVVGFLGMGSVLLSRFGTRIYPDEGPTIAPLAA